MSLRPPWRRPAFVVLPFALILVLVYDYLYVDENATNGYWLAVTAQSAVFLYLSAAPAAVGAAIEGSRFRAAGAATATSSRPPIYILLQHTWPSLVAGAVVQLSGLALVSRSALGSPGGPSVLVIAAFAAIILLHTMLGYCLGRLLPPVVSVPAALFLSYVWLGFTWSVAYFPLRYLAGLALVSCCRIDQAMPTAAPLAAIAFSAPAAVALTLLGTTRWRGRSRTRPLAAATAVVLVACASGSGLLVARDLGPQPFEPRDPGALRCEGTRPEICLYPEQEDPGVRSVLWQAYENLSRVGMPLAPRIAASSRPSTAATYNLAITNDASADDLIHSFSTAFLAPALIADCPAGAEARRAAVSVIVSWLAMHAAEGVADANGIPYGAFQRGRAGAVALSSLDSAAQIEWITYNRAAVLDCSRDARPVP